MRKFNFAVIAGMLLWGCATNAAMAEADAPQYVLDAKQQLESSIKGRVIGNPDFGCHELMFEEQWTIGCFVPSPNPIPFLLLKVNENDSKYSLIAVNGKARQYAGKRELRHLNIDTSVYDNTNIDKAIKMFVEKYPN